jgi:transcriptional regulator with XRE-family HTH domain
VGQTPKALDGSLSVLHFFGAELRRLREIKKLSQDELGRLVRFSGDTIRRVETAERFPRRELARACDEVLETDGLLERIWRLSEHERPSRAGTSVVATLLPGTASRDLGQRCDPHSNHRIRVSFLPGTLDRAALDWLLAAEQVNTDSAWRRRRTGDCIDEDDVERAASVMRVFRELDHARGAGPVHAEVEEYIATELNPMLARPPSTHDVGTRINALSAGFFELSGYQAVDTGVDGVAQQRYLRALRLSQAAGDRAYGAYLLAVNIGHLSLHCNHPEPALRMARAAVTGARDASPAVRAALNCVVARAHARLGHHRECLEEVLAAEAELGRSRPETEPVWIKYFTPAYLADELAHCFYDLGDYTTARRHLGDALDGLQPRHVRRLAIDTALLASSLAAEGHIDRACAVGMTAVDHATKTTSHRCVQRIAGLRVQLELYGHEPEVRDFLDYVREHLPAAT